PLRNFTAPFAAPPRSGAHAFGVTGAGQTGSLPGWSTRRAVTPTSLRTLPSWGGQLGGNDDAVEAGAPPAGGAPASIVFPVGGTAPPAALRGQDQLPADVAGIEQAVRVRRLGQRQLAVQGA